jgi:hypothetical protein
MSIQLKDLTPNYNQFALKEKHPIHQKIVECDMQKRLSSIDGKSKINSKDKFVVIQSQVLPYEVLSVKEINGTNYNIYHGKSKASSYTTVEEVIRHITDELFNGGDVNQKHKAEEGVICK